MNRLMISSSAIGILYSVMNMLLIPRLTFEMHSGSAAGMIMSLGMVASIIITPVMGFLCDRYEVTKKMIVVLYLSGSIFLFSMPFSTGIICAVSSFSLVCISYVILTPYSAMVGKISPYYAKDRNFGLVMGTVNLSVFLSSILIERMSERNLIYIIFSITAFLMIFPILGINNSSRDKQNETSDKPKDIDRNGNISFFRRMNKELIFFFGIQFFSWFVIGGIMPYLTTFLSYEISLDIGNASFYLGLSTLISSLASFSCGFVCKFINHRLLLTISILTMSVLLLVMGLYYGTIIHSDIFMGMIFLLSGSISIGFFYSLGVSILSKITDYKNQGKIFGINSFFMILSQAISVGLAGKTIENFGFKVYWIIMSISILFSLAFTILFLLSEKKHCVKEQLYEKNKIRKSDTNYQ